MTRQEIERPGFHVARRGQAWAITGPGVSILAVDLRLIRERDLRPDAPSTLVRLHETEKT